MTEASYWIWYPGDFELYHAMKQNFSRIERGVQWPAFWKSEGFRNRVVFRRVYQLEEKTVFTVYSNAIGYVLAGEKKYPFGEEIVCEPKEIAISVHAACIEQFPSIYIVGDVIHSDLGWMVEDYDRPAVPAGYSRYFTGLPSGKNMILMYRRANSMTCMGTNLARACVMLGQPVLYICWENILLGSGIWTRGGENGMRRSRIWNSSIHSTVYCRLGNTGCCVFLETERR